MSSVRAAAGGPRRLRAPNQRHACAIHSNASLCNWPQIICVVHASRRSLAHARNWRNLRHKRGDMGCQSTSLAVKSLCQLTQHNIQVAMRAMEALNHCLNFAVRQRSAAKTAARNAIVRILAPLLQEQLQCIVQRIPIQAFVARCDACAEYLNALLRSIRWTPFEANAIPPYWPAHSLWCSHMSPQWQRGWRDNRLNGHISGCKQWDDTASRRMAAHLADSGVEVVL